MALDTARLSELPLVFPGFGFAFLAALQIAIVSWMHRNVRTWVGDEGIRVDEALKYLKLENYEEEESI